MQPLKIIVEMKAPIILGAFPITLDSILAGIKAEMSGMEINNLEDVREIDLPLKKTNDYYHASIMLWDEEEIFISGIRKTFPTEYPETLRSKKVDPARGSNKNHNVSFTCMATPYVYFYAYGEKNEIAQILSNLYRIGPKKTGWGRTGRFAAKAIPEDRSLYLEPGIPARPIPVKEPTGFTVTCAYKPPYWLHENKALCIMPPVEMWYR